MKLVGKIALGVAALSSVAGLGYVTKGYTDWNVTNWANVLCLNTSNHDEGMQTKLKSTNGIKLSSIIKYAQNSAAKYGTEVISYEVTPKFTLDTVKMNVTNENANQGCINAVLDNEAQTISIHCQEDFDKNITITLYSAKDEKINASIEIGFGKKIASVDSSMNVSDRLEFNDNVNLTKCTDEKLSTVDTNITSRSLRFNAKYIEDVKKVLYEYATSGAVHEKVVNIYNNYLIEGLHDGDEASSGETNYYAYNNFGEEFEKFDDASNGKSYWRLSRSLLDDRTTYYSQADGKYYHWDQIVGFEEATLMAATKDNISNVNYGGLSDSVASSYMTSFDWDKLFNDTKITFNWNSTDTISISLMNLPHENWTQLFDGQASVFTYSCTVNGQQFYNDFGLNARDLTINTINVDNQLYTF